MDRSNFLNTIAYGTRSTDVFLNYQRPVDTIDGFFKKGAKATVLTNSEDPYYSFDLIAGKQDFDENSNCIINLNKVIPDSREYTFAKYLHSYFDSLTKYAFNSDKVRQQRQALNAEISGMNIEIFDNWKGILLTEQNDFIKTDSEKQLSEKNYNKTKLTNDRDKWNVYYKYLIILGIGFLFLYFKGIYT